MAMKPEPMQKADDKKEMVHPIVKKMLEEGMAMKPEPMQKADDKKEMIHPIVKKMLEEGIPVYRADFHSAVNNSDDVPETNFSDSSNAQSRRVKMWWINCDGLLCLHKNKYFFVPEATVKFAKFY